MKKFWMVYINGTPAPRVMHGTYNSAYHELQRLTQLTQKEGYILETVASSEYKPPVQPVGTVTITRL